MISRIAQTEQAGRAGVVSSQVQIAFTGHEHGADILALFN